MWPVTPGKGRNQHSFHLSKPASNNTSHLPLWLICILGSSEFNSSMHLFSKASIWFNSSFAIIIETPTQFPIARFKTVKSLQQVIGRGVPNADTAELSD